MLTKTTSVFLLTLYSLATINGQMLNEDEIIAEEEEEVVPLGESVAFWLIFFCVIWMWIFGRKVAIHGLDYVIRQPNTLVFIMVIMYVISWGLIELSFLMAGGYDPKMKSFGSSAGGDAFNVSLVLCVGLLCLLMWGMCSKCAAKYSTFSIEKKAAKNKAKNPYTDRGKEAKPLNSIISMIFCVCGAKGVQEDGIDAQEHERDKDALKLVPPPPPTNEVYDANTKKLKEWKQHQDEEKSHDTVHTLIAKGIEEGKELIQEAIKFEHQAEKSLHNFEEKTERALLDARLEMEYEANKAANA